MNVIFLKVRFLVFFTLLFSVGVQAQNPHFIYIQAESKQPFYVKIDKKVLSSSATGYIIIPGLIKNTYQLTVGFPKNEWPEFNVTVNVKDSDVGLLLKRTDNKNWGIVNLQSNESLSSFKNESTIDSEGDEFARILAQVVNDPSIAQVKVVKKAEEKTEDKVVKADDTKTTTQAISKEDNKSDKIKAVQEDSVIDKTGIAKFKQESTSEGLLITYLDVAGSATDTVKVFLPVNKIKSEEKEAELKKIPETIVQKPETIKNDSRFLDMELQNPNAKKDTTAITKDDFVITEKKAEINSAVAKLKTETIILDTSTVMINSDCKKVASQTDFLELRKNMAAATAEEEMLKTANKQFIKTCFTTEQIKNLGVLFIIEKERYRFYVAAFPFVSDTHNFSVLEDELTDKYYKTRFKAMISH